MDPIAIVLLALYGTGISLAIARYIRDKSRVDMNRPDRALRVVDDLQFRTETREVFLDGASRNVEVVIGSRRLGPSVETAPGFAAAYQKNGWRLRVPGLEVARVAAFRLTKSNAPGATLDVSAKSEAARAVLENPDVRLALGHLLGAHVKFRAIDLYPDADLIIDCLPLGDLQGPAHRDVVARLIDFAAALEKARPSEGGFNLGSSSSASGAPVSFSIKI